MITFKSWTIHWKVFGLLDVMAMDTFIIYGVVINVVIRGDECFAATEMRF